MKSLGLWSRGIFTISGQRLGLWDVWDSGMPGEFADKCLVLLVIVGLALHSNLHCLTVLRS